MRRRWSTRQELIHEVVALAAQRVKQRAIARVLGVSRNTVARILEVHRRDRAEAPAAPPPEKPPRAPRPTRLDGLIGKIRELLESYPEITAQRIFEELQKVGYAGSYSAVKRLVRRLRPPRRPAPSLPTPEYGPGRMAESDWSPFTVDFGSGKRAVVQVFVYALVSSTRKAFAAYERSDHYALCDGHVAAFERFGGCAHECKYDSQRAVVLGWEGNQPIFNPRFLAFCTHYEYRPVAARRRHPNDKPRAERSFWEFERSFLNGRRFRDLDDFREQLREWERTVCDLRPDRHDKSTPLDRFAEEKPHLVPVPRHPFDTARVVYRVCSLEGFVAWDGNEYAVPYDHVTDILPVRITQHELFVYAPDVALVARHELAPRSAGQRLDPQGFHRPRARTAVDLDQLCRTYRDLGEEAAVFFAGLVSAQGRAAGHHARQILLLRERFATADLLRAFRHAHAFGAHDHHAIGRILAARAPVRRLAEFVADDSARRLEGLLGPDLTQPRDLDEYDRLPVTSSLARRCPCPDDPDLPTPTPSPSDSGDTSTSSD